MVIILYQVPSSPPCRLVRMVCKILNLPLEMRTLDFARGEHMKPEFLKINPFHCVPTIIDDGFALWESRAIMTYLVNKYSPGHELYPSDARARATIDRWLYWDASSLYAVLFSYYLPIIRKAHPDPSIGQIFVDKVNLLDLMLSNQKYLCGTKITLADLAILTTITTASAADLDVSPFWNVNRWLKQLQKDLPLWNELVSEPVEAFRKVLKS